MEFYSVVQCIRLLIGQLSVVQLPMLAWGVERGSGGDSTSYA